MKVILVFSVLVLLGARTSRAVFSLAGPYEAILERFEPCEGNVGSEMFGNLRLHKKSKDERVFEGNITIPFDLDNNTGVKFSAEKWGSGGWGKNAYVGGTKAACVGLLKVYPSVFKYLFGAMGAPHACPLRAGHYVVKDLRTTYHFERFPMLPYGKYRIELKFHTGEETKGCFKIYGESQQIALMSFG